MSASHGFPASVRSVLRVDRERMRAFTELSGDTNPIHLDDDSARGHGHPRQVAYAGLLVAEVSRIIGTRIPGPGALCVSYNFDFKAPAYVGEAVVFEASVAQFSEAAGALVLEIEARREGDGEIALRGTAVVRVPRDGLPGPPARRQDG